MEMNEKQEDLVISRTADMLELARKVVGEINERDEEGSFETPAIVELVSVGQLIANMSALGFFREKLEEPIDPKIISAITKAVMEGLDKVIDIKIRMANLGARVNVGPTPSRAVPIPAAPTFPPPPPLDIPVQVVPMPPGRGPRPMPFVKLGQNVCVKVADLLVKIWKDPIKDDFARYVAGWFADEGVKLDCAKLIIGTASDLVKSDKDVDLLLVEGMYEDFMSGAAFANIKVLESVIRIEFPPESQDEMRKTIQEIQELIGR